MWTITAKSSIYHPFVIVLVLKRSRRRKRKKKKMKKVADGVSGFDLYLLIEQLVVFPQINIFSLWLVHPSLALKHMSMYL